VYAPLGLLFATSGSALFTFFLHTVESDPPVGILIIATLLMALSAVFSFLAIKDNPTKNTLYFLLIITILSLSINLIPTARYEVFSGLGSPDSLDEYFVADVTLRNGFWGPPYGVPLEGRPIYYFSCLSVTIFPAILSEITGLDLSQVFGFIFPIIFSFIPAIIFLVIDRFFLNTKLAALSAILYLEMYRFSAPSHGREFTAILFLVLMVFTIVKGQVSSKNTRKYLLLFFLFGFGVVTSHYTVSYFAVVIFFGMVLALYLPLRLNSSSFSFRFVNKYTFVYVLVLCFSWLLFFNFEYLVANISVIKNSILAILKIVEPRWLSFERAPGRTAGTLVTAWYIFQTVLMIIGLFYAFSKRKNKTRSFFAWLLSAFILFVIFFLTLVTPIFSTVLAFNRVYSISLLFWVPFLAYVLLKTSRRPMHLLLIFFLIINLPINLSLPTYDRLVTFSSIKYVSPDLAISETFSLKSDFLMWEWAQRCLSFNQSVTADARGLTTMFFVHTLIQRNVVEPNFGSDSNYLALHYYNVKHELWWSAKNISRTTKIAEIIVDSNVIYSSGESFMLMKRE
jgi:uncharacterized membrane protein